MGAASVTGGAGTEHVEVMAALPGGDVALAGTFSGTSVFGSVTFTAAGPNDVFVARVRATP